MTDNKRERIAKFLLVVFREIWCDRESDKKTFFNCSKCEFEMDDHICALKKFLISEKYKDEFPEGAILEEQSDE